jgi:hypothetical protein
MFINILHYNYIITTHEYAEIVPSRAVDTPQTGASFLSSVDPVS